MSEPTCTTAERLILHVDLDAFYASVEQLDFPELRGQPVIVGGLGGRGVVSAASYEARAFAIHSAMPISRARQRCPQAHFRAVRMDRYRELSRQVFGCFRALTPEVEGLSLDEAFLDLSADPAARTDPEALAEGLRRRIRDEIGLIASVGIAPNKFVAKLASDVGKPDGLVHVPAHGVQAFLDPLPVERLWGVGEGTTLRLRRAGLSTFGSLRRVPEPRLRGLVGRQASRLKALAAGRDRRPVKSERPTHSLSTERTFDRDLSESMRMRQLLTEMAEQLAARLREQSLETTSLTVKLRSRDFRTHTRQQRLNRPSASGEELRQVAIALAEQWWQQQPRPPRLRLLGIGARELVKSTGQMGLFQDASRLAETDRLLDAARERFGAGVLRRGLRRRG
ncbi:DNA polymerase IV [Gammaproteobacteria bacterium AB-CW1]|uniref:DNA polymerase IV n=1 Tax=Natronospira elongata TaxID=3110268 RepID=A0AAP6MK55_9GAMM|nr:DNA polymerase IV [Gammaproteobacteria bacterium AB-CW1]